MAFDFFGNHRVIPGLEEAFAGVHSYHEFRDKAMKEALMRQQESILNAQRQQKPIQKVTACSSHVLDDYVNSQCKFCGESQFARIE
jgi:hypothetical protein